MISDKEWQAQSDASTLKAAAEIQANAKRRSAATAQLKKEAARINKVISPKPNKVAPKKRG